MIQPRNVWKVGATLGEGPVWVGDALWFVDIKQRTIHRLDPETGEKSSWTAPEQVGFLYPSRDGGFVAGLQSGLFAFDPNGGAFEKIVDVEPDRPTNRLNDAVVDASGRLWFGTMDDSERSTSGSFYCFHRGRLVRTGLTGVAITNGPAISPDGRFLYWVDTLHRAVGVCEIMDDGTLGPSAPFTLIDRADGHPDGPTVDVEGGVWISLFGGWAVNRYDPDGKLVEKVRFPVANITKIAFGGRDLATAYATTARLHLRPEEFAGQPEAGDLFAFDAGVAGLRCPLVEM